jgi:hypothetical protein
MASKMRGGATSPAGSFGSGPTPPSVVGTLDRGYLIGIKYPPR